jgi:hypothetical protein
MKLPENNSFNHIPSFDLARGFTVLFMPSIHVLMLYSKPEVQGSAIGEVFRFIAEGPGAQLFMLLMGVFLVRSKRVNTRYVLRRTLLLLLSAYVLNIFKFVTPLMFGWLPKNLLEELQLTDRSSSILFFISIGDILHFAAISYPLLYCIHRFKSSLIISITMIIMILCFSSYLWDLQTNVVTIDKIILLFNGHPPQTFFPVFPWLVYPLTGMIIGYCLKVYPINKVMKTAALAGCALMFVSFCMPVTVQNVDWPTFYRSTAPDTIYHIGLVLCWLAFFFLLHRIIPGNPFFRLLCFCSRQITAIYVIQWLLICWCLVFTGYLQLDLVQSLCWMFFITALTFFLTYLVTYSHANKTNL